MNSNYNPFVKKKKKTNLTAFPKLFDGLPLKITISLDS